MFRARYMVQLFKAFWRIDNSLWRQVIVKTVQAVASDQKKDKSLAKAKGTAA